MNRILFYCVVCGALFSSPVRAQASDTATDSVSPIDAHAGEQARVELTKGAVDLALLSAESKLTERRFDDAIAMAWAGLEQADKLSPSDERSTLVQSLMQVIIDSRVQKRLFSEGRESDKVDRADSLPPSQVPRNYDPGTGLSTVRPPKNQAPLAEALVGLGEDPELTEKIVVYPEDWQLPKARTGNSTGVLYEGPPFENNQGQVVQTIVYDVRSLLLPRFNLPRWHPIAKRFDAAAKSSTVMRTILPREYRCSDTSAGLAAGRRPSVTPSRKWPSSRVSSKKSPRPDHSPRRVTLWVRRGAFEDRTLR